jgi:hypothetical protein
MSHFITASHKSITNDIPTMQVFVHVDADERANIESSKSSKPDRPLDAESGLRGVEGVRRGSVVSVMLVRGEPTKKQ